MLIGLTSRQRGARGDAERVHLLGPLGDRPDPPHSGRIRLYVTLSLSVSVPLPVPLPLPARVAMYVRAADAEQIC